MVSIIVMLGTVFFSDVLFLGKILFAGDNLTINAPAKVLFFEILKNGQLPLWNPYVFSGTPFLADINLGLLSPFNVFYLFFSPLTSLSFSIVAAVIVCGVGMYLCARSFHLSPFASLVAGVVYMLSGTVMTHTMNTAILNTIALFPLIIACIQHVINTGRIKYSLITSILLALSLFGGHVQYFYYIILFSLVFIIASNRSWKEKIKIICFIYIPTCLLTLIQTLPFLEYVQFSTRPVQNLDYSGTTSLVSFIHLLLPNFFGVMKDGTSWGATADINGYVGIIPLLISLFAVYKQRKNRYVLFLALIALISFFIALGKRSPIYLFCFYVLPFFARFRSPTSILFLYTFCISVLTGFGVQYIFEKYTLKVRGSILLILGFLCFILTGIGLYIQNTQFYVFVNFMNALNTIKNTAFITRFLEYSLSRMQIIFNLWTNSVVAVVFIIGIFCIFLYVLKRQRSSVYVQFICVLLIATELMLFAGNNYITTTSKRIESPREITNFFQSKNGLFRILPLMDPGTKPPFANPMYFENEAIKANLLYQPNVNILEGEQSITGYASVVPNYYAAYMNSNTKDPTSITLPRPGMQQLNELNVKYVITAGRYEKELKKNKQYVRVFSYSDNRINRVINIYENKLLYPRAYLVDNKYNYISSAQILKYNINEIRVRAMAFKSGHLIVSEMFYPGWEVTIDGKRAPLEQYKVYRRVKINKGMHEIIFSYQPKSFYIGAFISVVNWIYVLGFLGFVLYKEHKQIRKKLHVGKS